MTCVELLARYVGARDLERGTVQWFTLIVGRFCRHCGGAASVDDLSPQRVGEWLTAMVDEGRLSRTTIKDYRRGLLILWRWGYSEGLCPHAPLGVKPIKAPLPVPRGWSAADVNRLLDAAAKLKGSYRCGLPRALWFAAIIRVAWDTGLRPSDLMRLTADDFNRDGAGAIVQHKTGNPVAFQLRPSTLLAIASIRPHSRTRIFGGVVSRSKFYRAMGKLVKAAGLSSGGLKKIRKGGASEVERLLPGRGHLYLGHKTPGIAEKHYFDARIIGRDAPLPPELG